MITNYPTRHIHLDFHTSPHIPNVGSAFDPDDFAETMKASEVDSVEAILRPSKGLLKQCFYTVNVQGGGHHYKGLPELGQGMGIVGTS